jgi:hypothetical protein
MEPGAPDISLTLEELLGRPRLSPASEPRAGQGRDDAATGPLTVVAARSLAPNR